MTHERFTEEIVRAEFERVLKIGETKGKDYARYDRTGDRLANFKSVAARVGITPLQAWSVYALKHIDAVCSFVTSGGQNESEPIEGRIDDVIVYMLLLKGLIVEAKDAGVAQAGPERGLDIQADGLPSAGAVRACRVPTGEPDTEACPV